MKIKTALKSFLIFTFLALCFAKGQAFAQPLESKDVVVSASIDVDLFSKLSLVPTTVEVLQPTNVNITALHPDGTARVGRTIVIYIQGDATGITITQPGPTNSSGKTTGQVSSNTPGSYVVCAKDVTEGYDIMIQDCKNSLCYSCSCSCYVGRTRVHERS
jgi:hypothetical protein